MPLHDVPRDVGGILPHLAPGLGHFRVALCYLGCLCWALQAPRVCVPSVSLIGGAGWLLSSGGGLVCMAVVSTAQFHQAS